MTKFVQAMEQFATTYGTVPHFSDAEMFMTRAAGTNGFSLELETTEIGAMVSIIRRDRSVAASFLALGETALSLRLLLTSGDMRETVTFALVNDEWQCTSTAQNPALQAVLRFAQGAPFDFSDWTLRQATLDFTAAMPAQMAA